MATTNNKGRKKTALVVALCAVLCIGAVAGVYAWFSVQDSAINQFSVGDIKDPTVDPDPTNPTEPGTKPNADGKLTETKWVVDSKIGPNATVPKNPNVGIGAGSEDAWVFVEVENMLDKEGSGSNSYFEIDPGLWAPVAGMTTGYIGDGKNANTYVSGLFVYLGDPAGTDTAPNKLPAATDADNYTGELFSVVKTNGDFTSAEKPVMNVKAYLAALSSDKEATDYTAILQAAKDWSNNN